MKPIRVVATYLLFLSLTINIIVLVTPGIVRVNKSTETQSYQSYGFFAHCECQWYSNIRPSSSDSPSTKFVQHLWVHWLYIGSVAIMNICLYTWFILCFFGKRALYMAMAVIGVFMLIAAGLIAATIVHFALKASSEMDVTLDGKNQFGWAFWLAIGGFALCALSALVFIVQGINLYKSAKRGDDQDD